jgi:SAM-dependent methyltransferase
MSITATKSEMRGPNASEKSQSAWAEHWSVDRQNTIAQRFFSFYRKAIFARTVSYFFDRYFPSRGVFVEAGSGTAETSMRIDKCRGGRTLIATDIVQAVLKECHPNMDVRVCGDIFRLPFADASIDGIWNVGVMEHFTRDEIDTIMSEFHRVLKPDHRIILLIPGADSLPQKILRMLEKIINSRRGEQAEFRFHPPEISQVKSKAEGIQMLRRNGFDCLRFEYGWRSLLAFKTLVGTKVNLSV